MKSKKPPPVWSKHELDTARRRSIEDFRKVRLDEPLEKYGDCFDNWQGYFENLLESLVDLIDERVRTDEALVETFSESHMLEAFRYLAGPPISEDDLKVLAEVVSLSPTAIRQNPESAQRIFSIVWHQLDRRRFTWVFDQREPSEDEKRAAIIASATLKATQDTKMQRRTEQSQALEDKVKETLNVAGFRQVRTRKIVTFAQAPAPGEFCSESKLGTRKADVIARLLDDRILAIECKVSNSATNSIKRLNNDAAVKAKLWRKELGTIHVIPTAVLSGVFNLRHLIAAQKNGLTLWWEHDLDHFAQWVSEAV